MNSKSIIENFQIVIIGKPPFDAGFRVLCVTSCFSDVLVHHACRLVILQVSLRP